MIRTVLLLLYLGVICSASGQNGFVLVKDEALVRQKFAEIPKKITSIKAAFVQEKNLSALADKLISKGFFYFEKDNKVRLEYTTPFKYLMVMNNGKMLVKDDAKTSKVDLRSNKIFQSVNRIMTDCVNGTALTNPDFSTKVFESSTQYKLEMTPIGKGMKDFFKVIYIFIEKKDYSASRLELHEKSADNTIITFQNKELNKPLAATLFAVK